MKPLTWEDIEAAAKLGYGDGKAPRLSAMAEFINRELPPFRAELRDYSEVPYKKIGRLRYDYKRRHGKMLEVWRKITAFPSNIVRPEFTHNTCDPYRRNSEVARWIIENRTEKPR